MVTWNEFETALKNKTINLIKEKEIDESTLQFEKIMANTLKELFIKESIIKRKKLEYNYDKQIPGKSILYRDDSKIEIKE